MWGDSTLNSATVTNTETWLGLCRPGWHTKPQALHPGVGAQACILSEKLLKAFHRKRLRPGDLSVAERAGAARSLELLFSVPGTAKGALWVHYGIPEQQRKEAGLRGLRGSLGFRAIPF